jgi:hypothetical protein
VINDSGGIIKGEKSFGYMFEYTWDDDGQWFYKPTLDYNLQIQLPDGTFETIELLEPGDARVTLGVAACPTGDDSHHPGAPGNPKDKWKSVKTKAEVWLMRLKNGHLPSKYAWVSYRLQLWASIRYGLGVLSAPLSSFGELCPNSLFKPCRFWGSIATFVRDGGTFTPRLVDAAFWILRRKQPSPGVICFYNIGIILPLWANVYEPVWNTCNWRWAAAVVLWRRILNPLENIAHTAGCGPFGSAYLGLVSMCLLTTRSSHIHEKTIERC